MTRIEAEDYVQLMELINGHLFPPPGFLFWVTHMQRDAAMIWAECPRSEWLLWIADCCGIGSVQLERVRLQVELELEDRQRRFKRPPESRKLPETFALDAADLVRAQLDWRQCLHAPRMAAAVRQALEASLPERAVA